MAYTQDGIMAQVWVAFGQGTGAMHVHQDAALALHGIYSKSIDQKVLDGWKTGAVHALERVRAVGRAAAAKAAARGATVISAADVESSASTVHKESMTDWCPPPTTTSPSSAGGQKAP